MPIQNDVKKSNEEYVEEKLREMMLNFYSNNTNYEDEKNGCENIIRTIVNDCKQRITKEKIFVQHIENHLKQMGIKGKVVCKICEKDIDTIASEEGLEVKE